MRMIDCPADAWICVLTGLLLYAVSTFTALKDSTTGIGRRLGCALLPPVTGLICAKAGYELLQPEEIASVFRWCFTTGTLGLLAGTFLAAKATRRDAGHLLDRSAPFLCLAVVLARLSQRWLGEVGAGPWLEEGTILCRPPLILVNEWNETLLALFVPEALAALTAMGVACGLRRKEIRQNSGAAPGRTAVIALLFLTVPQILLEQFRTGHYMHWRMVRAEQVLCALSALGAILVYHLTGGRRKRTETRKILVPAAIFLLMCTVVAFVQFVLDGKLTELPEPVCWSMYCLAVAGMLVSGCAAVPEIKTGSD